MRPVAGLLASLALSPAFAQVPAFPGAEGFGSSTPGGRGGVVIEVTSLADSGPGTLRAAVEATGPRIVVFRVSGTIVLDRPIAIRNPYITIAGQTAPGEGIAIRNGPANAWSAMSVQTHDVILRYLRLRPGRGGPTGVTNDALQIVQNAWNVIVDHCSMSWGTDEILDMGGTPAAHDVTVQWSILSEGLATETTLYDSKGVLIAGAGCERGSFHHNLLAHNQDRNPRVGSEGVWDLVNNLIYDPGRANADLTNGQPNPILANFVGNVVRPGPGSQMPINTELKIYEYVDPPQFAVYVRDNLGPNRPTGTEPETAILSCFTIQDPPPHTPCDPLQYVVPVPHDVPPVTTWPAAELIERLLPGIGATRPVRDSVDACVVEGVRTLSGGIILDPAQGCGPWPDLAGGLPPDDGDHDGMPDLWEAEHGFSAADPSDGPLDADGDGWTNVEEFLNETHPRDLDNDGQPDDGDCAPADPQGGTPPAVANVKFVSATELRWDPAPFAEAYDVTRGTLAGLAASDYGVCTPDPDPHDTAFPDPDAPLPEGSFTYLVRGLDFACPAAGSMGTRSTGEERVNENPGGCP